MKKIYFLLLILFVCCKARQYKNNSNQQSFEDFKNECGLIFTMPKGFSETKIKKMKSVVYQYAIKDSTTELEVRYYIQSFNGLKKAMDSTLLNSNNMSNNFFVSILLNASGNVLPNVPKINKLDSISVKSDLKGDYAATAKFVPNTEFGKGFNECIAIVVRKNNLGNFFIFMMINDFEKEKKSVVNSTNALRFKTTQW